MFRIDRGRRSTAEADVPEVDGAPIGRRTILGLIALAGAGVIGGKAVQDGLAKILAPIELRDPTGLISLIPLGDAFRFYSVTGSVPTQTPGPTGLRLSAWSRTRRRTRWPICRRCRRPRSSATSSASPAGACRRCTGAACRSSTLLDRAGPAAGGDRRPVPLLRRHLHREPDPRPGPALGRHRRPADARQAGHPRSRRAGADVRRADVWLQEHEVALWHRAHRTTSCPATGSTPAATPSTAPSARRNGATTTR